MRFQIQTLGVAIAQVKCKPKPPRHQ